MARVSTYLNFPSTTEAAFEFYRSVFGTEFEGPVMRMGDVPMEGMPPLSEAEQRSVMHVALPILGGHLLMGTDLVESLGHTFQAGNNISINLEPDTRDEADRLSVALSEGGTEATGMSEMLWGAYWGSCVDRFGLRWMVNHAPGG
jgi:PhnB protein